LKKKFVASFIIGILIALTPTLIVGRLYNVAIVMGPLLVAEFLIRNISRIIGLLVIYDGFKNYYHKTS